MGLAMLKTQPPDPIRKLDLPQVKILHRPVKNEQFIQDTKKATDILLGLRLYLQNRAN